MAPGMFPTHHNAAASVAAAEPAAASPAGAVASAASALAGQQEQQQGQGLGMAQEHRQKGCPQTHPNCGTIFMANAGRILVARLSLPPC
jgi:hypothetical protein